jgi:GT2 family glycosyltransferase
MPVPNLSVVIVNYNTCDLLRACLASLTQSTLPVEIIVVDNASSDGSAAMVRAEFPAIKLLAQANNTWFCGGNNLGIAAAQGEFVLLLNPDTVVPADALHQMVTYAQAHPEYAGVTAQLVYPTGAIQRTCSRLPTYTYLLVNHSPLGWLFARWREQLNAHIWYTDWGRDTDANVAVVPGSCVLMRREAIHLNDDLLLYFPEEDLARRTGKPFRYLASVRIEHHEKSATRSWLATRVYFRDMLLYTRQHHGMIAMLLLWLLSRPLYWGMWVKARLKR